MTKSDCSPSLLLLSQCSLIILWVPSESSWSHSEVILKSSSPWSHHEKTFIEQTNGHLHFLSSCRSQKKLELLTCSCHWLSRCPSNWVSVSNHHWETGCFCRNKVERSCPQPYLQPESVRTLANYYCWLLTCHNTFYLFFHFSSFHKFNRRAYFLLSRTYI